MKKYTWEVTNLITKDIDAKTDYVIDAIFKVSGEEEVDGTLYSYSLDFNNAAFAVSEESDFVPYEDLTNEIVVGWIKKILGAKGVADYEAAVGNMIDGKIYPSIPNKMPKLPW